MAARQGPNHISMELVRIAEKARTVRGVPLTSLSKHISECFLHEAYARTRKDGAVGVDRKSSEDYAENLTENIKKLHEQFKSGSYKAPPVRRVHIPKGDGTKTRPIGIPTFEDKVLQRAVTMVLNEVYEREFYEFSFGFRPGKSQHKALDYLRSRLMSMGGGWVLEVDIKGYFDNIDHQKLREYLAQRIGDGVIRRIIGKWLKAGVMEDGEVHRPDSGSPQGGVISPLLSNVFLHETVDRWFVQEAKPRLRGKAEMVRYADDFIMVFQKKEDAELTWNRLDARMTGVGLTLHPEKTKLTNFLAPAQNRPKPGSFDFLGFTHYWAKSQRGWPVVKLKTAKDRLKRSLKKADEVCRKIRSLRVKDQHARLKKMLEGHYNYYGVTCNGKSICRFFHGVKLKWKKWLSRRSQRAYVSFRRLEQILDKYPLPEPKLPRSVYAKS